MDYQEALDLKNSKNQNTFFKNGIEYVWMVVPKTEKYLEEYAKEVIENGKVFEDKDSITYAKDGLFTIFGVKMQRDDCK